MLQRTRPGPVTETPATTPDQSDHDARTIVDLIAIDFARATFGLINDWIDWQRTETGVGARGLNERAQGMFVLSKIYLYLDASSDFDR